MQIQPRYAQRDEWTALAARYNATFEALEVSVPDAASPESLAWHRGCGMVTSVHGAFIDINPASGDPAIAQVSVRRIEESCRLALEYGAENVVFHYASFPFLRGGYTLKCAEKSAEVYNGAVEKFGVKIFIENSFELDPGPMAEFMRHAGKNVGVCLDIGHANYSRAPLGEWFDALGESIGYLHISDNNGLFDDHLAVGDGTVDWALADKYYRALGKDVPVTVEAKSIEGAEKALRFVTENGFFGTGGSNG